jgi:hypothetical protein
MFEETRKQVECGRAPLFQFNAAADAGNATGAGRLRLFTVESGPIKCFWRLALKSRVERMLGFGDCPAENLD